MRTKGWRDILKFTLIQHVKTKSFVIGTVVVCVIVAAVCVLTNVLPVALGAEDAINGMISDMDGENPDEPALSFSNIYLKDDAGILTEEDLASLEKAGAKLQKTTQSREELKGILKGIADSDEPSVWEAALLISAVSGEDNIPAYYDVSVIYSKGSEDDADMLSALSTELVNRRNMLNLGVSEEDYVKTQIPVSGSIIEAGTEEWDIFTSVINYMVPIVVSLVLFMLIFSYGTTVAQSIATEKTSRVMELLLTSVRPLAIVIGKVLAMGIVSFCQFILIVSVGGLSLIISAPFGFIGQMRDIMASPEFVEMTQQTASGMTSEIMPGIPADMMDDVQMAQAIDTFMASFTPFNIILIIIIFLLGFLFFSLIAALVGASISRIEDLSAAMQPYSLMGVLGMYLAYFPVIFNVGSMDTGAATTNPVQIFSFYFPLSSPFALPSAILLGTLSKLQCVIATLVLAAAVVLVAILVSKIYEAIILHNGNRIKLGDMIKMAARK